MRIQQHFRFLLVSFVGLGAPRLFVSEEIIAEEWTRTENMRTRTIEFQSGGAHFHYDWDSRRLILRDEVDEEQKEIKTLPGTILWAAHPEKKQSCEEVFGEILEESGWKLRWSLEAPNGESDAVRHSEWLETAEKISSSGPFSARRLLSDLEQEVAATREEVLEFLDRPILRGLKKELIANDIIEPLGSQVSHSENRFDAFVLSPLRRWLEDPTAFREALSSLARERGRFPLEWFVAESQRFSYGDRLAVLMLLTHNHAAERILIRAVAQEEGLAEAWQYLLWINEIYRNERDFFKSRQKPRPKAVIEFPSGIDFLDAEQTSNIEISLNELILKPLFGFVELRQKSSPTTISFFQRYHLYGAFIASARLSNELELSDALVEKTTEALGLSYKIKSMGLNRRQLAKMREFYVEGANLFLKTKDLSDRWPPHK